MPFFQVFTEESAYHTFYNTTSIFRYCFMRHLKKLGILTNFGLKKVGSYLVLD